MITDINALYEYTLQQMAAESYFEGVLLGDTPTVRQRLIVGTNREGYKTPNLDLNEGFPGYTRMTSRQADEFLSKFTLVHQWSDNPSLDANGQPVAPRPAVEGNAAFDQLNDEILANTGLSATLIQDKRTGEFTLAIRSTEFRPWAKGGDGERDKSGADLSEIAFSGFAFAQQLALERYFQWLKDNNKLVGVANAKPIVNVTGYSLGGNLATVFTELHQGDSDITLGQTVTMNGAGRGTWQTGQGSLADMVAYYKTVLNDPAFAPDPGNGASQLRTSAIGRSALPFDLTNLYGDPRHVWAVQATRDRFGTAWQSLSDEYRIGTAADARITQLFGYETLNNTNFTANSGIHAPALRVGIESQPLIEASLAVTLRGIGTTVDDFGNGHSIALIVMTRDKFE